jgi:putative FmdB family regulatory protein
VEKFKIDPIFPCITYNFRFRGGRSLRNAFSGVKNMPIYEYRCQSCGHELEKLQRMSDAALTDCPECGKSELKRLVSAAAFRLKGGGWYETDFKKSNQRNLVDSGSEKSSSSDKSSGGDKSTVSSSAAETKKSDSGSKPGGSATASS